MAAKKKLPTKREKIPLDLQRYLQLEGAQNRKIYYRSLARPTKALQKFVDMTPEEQEEYDETVGQAVRETDAEMHANWHWTLCTMNQSSEEFSEKRFENLRLYQNEHDNFDPPEKCTVPEGGAWILIREMDILEFNVAPLSLWWAEPWPVKGLPYRVKVITPKGTLGVLPHEFSRVDPDRLPVYIEYLRKPIGYNLAFFGDAKAALPYDRLMYLMSRGIPQVTAIEMLLGELKSPGVCWFEPTEALLQTVNMEKKPGGSYVTPHNIEESVRYRDAQANAAAPTEEQLAEPPTTKPLAFDFTATPSWGSGKKRRRDPRK